ncbi:hypothetical protein DENSPDRAFT_837197 [Dentipellis sp. KUC8613]|nr:hypothetical protein DENSPDRAFT_837197 [Dentipellis sp. KUC8613]
MSLSALVSAYPLIKTPLLLGGGLAFYIATTPPHGPPPKEEKEKYGKKDTLSRFFPWRQAAFSAMLSYVLSNAAENVLLIARAFPTVSPAPTILSKLIDAPHAPHAGAASVGLPPAWLAGFVLLSLGGYLRWASYRHLGSLFTFHLTIRAEHRLVTSGPYALVRHPGYLGAVFTVAGVCVCMFGPGSLLYEGGWLESLWGKALRVGVALWSVGMSGALIARVPTEDAMLRKEFGEEWVRWAKRVPYAVVPGIY